MPQGWRNVLKLPEDTDDLIVMNKVGKVFTLPFIISTHIQRFADIPTDLYLGWRKDLAVAFRFVNFNSTFHEFGSRLSDSLLINIRFCAHELEKRMPEKNVSPEDLKTIRELAWELYQAVLGFELPPQIGRYLLSHLYLIIEAIDDYDITGAAGMERSFNAVIGAVVTDTPTSKEANESTFGDRFWGIVTKVGVVLKIAKTATELAEGVQKLLPNGK
jgi:hypothetical protein